MCILWHNIKIGYTNWYIIVTIDLKYKKTLDYQSTAESQVKYTSKSGILN